MQIVSIKINWPIVLSFKSEKFGGYEQFNPFWLAENWAEINPIVNFVSKQDKFECIVCLLYYYSLVYRPKHKHYNTTSNTSNFNKLTLYC